MDFLPGPFVTLVVVAAFILASGIKIASEHERFAVFRLGRFIGFKGPGLCFKLGTTEKWVRIKPAHHLAVGVTTQAWRRWKEGNKLLRHRRARPLTRGDSRHNCSFHLFELRLDVSLIQPLE
jgi:hypothetical protein